MVPVEEYLRTSYEPECEYLDGKLVERNGGTISHSHLQGLLAAYFSRRRRAWNITPLLSVHTRLGERRYCIPDLCVVRGPRPLEPILTSAPWIWIEVLSREDRMLPMLEKIRELIEFGCEWVWVIDSETLENRVFSKDSDFVPANKTFRIPGTDIVVPLAELEED